jgi:branched-chain amino acid transport system permease protein
MSSLVLQLLTGLASASALFLVASGLSLIFGVTRIVNFAHGSFYMLGLYGAVALSAALAAGPLGFWSAVLLSALLVAALGALIETTILRRLYAAPELYQLLATFALVLVIRDAALWAWGPEDLLGPKAPAMAGAVDILGRPFPSYDVFSIFVGPVVLGALWLLLKRTRWGLLVRAATQDREMVGALGVNQRWLFTSVFALGTFLAALGGALQMPHEPANLNLDLALIGEVFVVVVVGGMGSIGGAFVAAILVAMVKAFCIAAGTIDVFGTPFPLSKLTLVAEFLVMAVVLVWRPQGLFGKPQGIVRSSAAVEAPLRPLPARWRVAGAVALIALALVSLLAGSAPYAIVLMIDVLIAVLFAASLHFLIGPSGMHSFGHAAYFGLGAYGAALFFRLGAPMEASLLLAPLLAAAGAFVFGWFCVRLSGVYLAMLTLAFAQIVWSVVFQWDALTGGSNGLVGIWPAQWLAPKPVYYLLVLACTIVGAGLLVRILHAPLGMALRGSRDSPLRAAAIGIRVSRMQWLAFVIAGTVAGLAGSLFAFAKGTISPETLGVGKSVDGLVMVLLGGVHALSGPWVGAALFTWLQDTVARQTDYWRALLGVVMLALILVFPLGVAGGLKRLFLRDDTSAPSPRIVGTGLG